MPAVIEPVHPQTKAAAILELLSRRDGATIKELSDATNWQEHSVRGFLSGTLKKKRGLQVTHAIVDGMRRYHVDQPRSEQ